MGLENPPNAVSLSGRVLKLSRFGRDGGKLLAILSQVQKGLKITLDVGHANTVCEPSDYVRGSVT